MYSTQTEQASSAVQTCRFLFEKYRRMIRLPDDEKYSVRASRKGLRIEIETAREVVKLLKSRGTRYSEIAEATGCSVSSVRNIALGKHKICRQLQEAAQ